MIHAVRERFKDALLWDMVLPLAPSVGNDFKLVQRFADAGHHYVSLTIAGDDCGTAEAMHRLAGARRQIADRADRLRLVESTQDIVAAKDEGKLAVGVHLEGTECLERDVDMLDLLYALGIRHAILAFNLNNSAAGGCADLSDPGLSRFGLRLVDRMRELGMLLDLSHMGERSTLDAMERHGGPCVFTHSNAARTFPHFRNLSDKQVRACAAGGGMVGVSGSTAYLGETDDLARTLFRHIDYFVQLVGPQYVGFGTDYVGDTETVLRIFAERPDEWPTMAGSGPMTDIAYLPPEGIWDVIRHMMEAGYDDAAIRGIMGENWMRVASKVWR